MIKTLSATLELGDRKYYTHEVYLPKTTLLIVGNENGYFMCGALDVEIFDSKPHLKAREVVCGRALGVKTMEELIEGRLQSVSEAAKKRGIIVGIKVKEALELL